MTIEELGDQAPRWLREAKTQNANVEMIDGLVIWRSGTWLGGTWEGDTWWGGIWKDGIWENGSWWGGTWWRGIWKNGTWWGGIWLGGTWENGDIGSFPSSLSPLTINGLQWSVCASSDHLKIGCQHHTWEQWEAFSDDDLYEMHPEAPPLWRKWKPVLLGLQRRKNNV